MALNDAQPAVLTETSEPFSDDAYEVLRAAVNLARDEGIRTLARLQQRLAEVLPNVSVSVVNQALQFWANRIALTGIESRDHS